MANKTLTVQTTFKYVDEDGNQQSKSSTVTVPYGGAELEGALQVNAATADETDFVIPFGGILSATGFYVKNNCDVDLELTLNAGADVIQIAPGGEIHMAQPAKSLAVPLASAKLTTSALTTLPGTIAYKVFGDPI